MEYFWKENKKFVLAVGGGLVFLMLYYSFVLGPIRKGAADATRDRLNAKRDIERRMQRACPPSALVAARHDRGEAEAASVMIPGGVHLNERFVHRATRRRTSPVLPEPQARSRQGTQEEVGRGQAPVPQNVGRGRHREGQRAEVLARCAVVERLVTAAVESDLDKIEIDAST
jgi:hypothetical protein